MAGIFGPLERIIILQALEQAPGRELSNEMLQRCLKAQGVIRGIADVNTEIAWLENRGYARAVRLGDSGFINVHITRAGIDVALGNVRAEGIEAPPEN
jgi:hypothetical protein